MSTFLKSGLNESDFLFQCAVGFSSRPQPNPDTLTIWKSGYVRLFVSHRDHIKIYARQLADLLDGYGVSAFVAHETIEPMTTWRHEIIKGLETMEIMLAIVTDDFHQSFWTNQEVGFALGRGTPIISLKVQESEPPGFIEEKQAVRGSLTDPSPSASAVYNLIANRLGQHDRLKKTVIAAFLDSPDFTESQSRFNRMSSVVEALTDEELEQIKSSYKSNDQLHNCIYLNSNYNRLVKFIQNCTNKKFKIENKQIIDVRSSLDEDLPF
ncbi:MAG: TIR domain-containing protein [Alphaproteobacteria bacterium]